MTTQTVKQAGKSAIWPLLSTKRRHHKAPLRGAQGVLAHGMHRKDGESERIMCGAVLARARGCEATEPASCAPAMQLPCEEQQEPKE